MFATCSGFAIMGANLLWQSANKQIGHTTSGDIVLLQGQSKFGQRRKLVGCLYLALGKGALLFASFYFS